MHQTLALIGIASYATHECAKSVVGFTVQNPVGVGVGLSSFLVLKIAVLYMTSEKVMEKEVQMWTEQFDKICKRIELKY